MKNNRWVLKRILPSNLFLLELCGEIFNYIGVISSWAGMTGLSAGHVSRACEKVTSALQASVLTQNVTDFVGPVT